MQLLEPLRIIDIGLPSGHRLHIPRIDQQDLKPARFEQLEDRNPIDPGGLHRDRGDANRRQPLGQALQIPAERPKAADWLVVALAGDGGHVDRRPPLGAGRGRVDRGETSRSRTPGFGSIIHEARLRVKGDARAGAARSNHFPKRDPR